MHRKAGRTTGFISHGKMSTGVFQISAPERHHPTETLETVQFGVSNVPRGLLGPIDRHGHGPKISIFVLTFEIIV